MPAVFVFPFIHLQNFILRLSRAIAPTCRIGKKALNKEYRRPRIRNGEERRREVIVAFIFPYIHLQHLISRRSKATSSGFRTGRHFPNKVNRRLDIRNLGEGRKGEF